MRRGRWLLYGILLLALGFEGFVLWAEYERAGVKSRSVIPSNEGVDQTISLKLNGLEQYFLVRSRAPSRPVLLYIADGPGDPVFPGSREFSVQSGLQEDAILVQWEQRGAGKSYSADVKDFPSVPAMVKDTCVLAGHFMQEYEKLGTVLLGQGWGAHIALRAASQCPDQVRGVIAINTNVRPGADYDEVLAWAAGREKTATIQGPPGEQWDRVRDGVRRLGGYSKDTKIPSHQQKLFALATTPEYDVREAWQILERRNRVLNGVIPEWRAADLAAEVKELKVPLLMLHSKEDRWASPTRAEEFYQALKAEKKEWEWLEGHPHDVMKDQPKEMGAKILKTLRRWAAPPVIPEGPDTSVPQYTPPQLLGTKP